MEVHKQARRIRPGELRLRLPNVIGRNKRCSKMLSLRYTTFGHFIPIFPLPPCARGSIDRPPPSILSLTLPSKALITRMQPDVRWHSQVSRRIIANNCF